MGEKINLIEGNRENIKITNPEDLLISAALLQTKL
jgi:2-C-methyl-D-erythritol 4-phosphate cytidylyltransferase